MGKQKSISALKWIVGVLENKEVPYQIEGGLAAMCYGSTRKLIDIDIFIPSSGFAKIAEVVKKYSRFGPDYHVGTHWKLVYQILDFDGQQIELCDADNTEYLDTRNDVWIKRDIDFGKAETISKFGKKLKVIPKADLIEYKEKLGRDVDLVDVGSIR